MKIKKAKLRASKSVFVDWDGYAFGCERFFDCAIFKDAGRESSRG